MISVSYSAQKWSEWNAELHTYYIPTGFHTADLYAIHHYTAKR